MTERWKSYITQGVQAAGGPIPFALSQWTFLFPIFSAIRRALPSGGKVLDVGCGAGVFTTLLAHHRFQVVGVDEDSDIVAYASEMAKYFRSDARVEQASAFDLSRYYGQFDLVYSLGVIEHFDRQTTIQLLREQAKCSPLVLSVIPTKYTEYVANRTDERLYTFREFKKIFRQAGFEILNSFVHCNVPSQLSRNLERALPGALHRFLQRQFSYAISQCCLGRWAGPPLGG